MNNGVMIATNRLASIMESFQTSDSNKETSELGWGLCLSICDWLAGMHAGHHAVESEVGVWPGSLWAWRRRMGLRWLD